MSVTQSPLRLIHNGDMVVGMTDKKTVQSMQGYFDQTTLSAFYQQDPDKYNLGLIKLWGQQSKKTYPIYQQMMEKKAFLEVNGADGAFEYEIAIKDSGKCQTIRDYSFQENAGIDNSIFRIALNKRYAPGVKLTDDMFFGEQFYVTDEEETRQIPGGWDLPVKLLTNDREATYDTSKLVSGIQFFKIGHTVFGEYGTNYENIDLIDTPTTMKCRFQLGNMSGAETFMTGRAGMKNFSGAASWTKDYLDTLEGEAESMGEYAFVTQASNVQTEGGKVKFKNLKSLHLGNTLQLLLHREHQKSVATEVLFQKAGTITGTNSVQRVNEGLFHQMRRGHLIQYGRPMGITRAHIMEAVNYVFRVNDIPEEERFVEFSVGQFAKLNIYQIFEKEINAQAAQIARFMGADFQLPNKVVTGSNNMELSWGAVRFVEVYLTGIGNVRVKHDPSLDSYPGADRLAKGFHGQGHAHTTYSMVIWDVADQKYSNNNTLPKGAKLMEGGDAGANMYIVKPEAGLTFWGSENGRYSMESNSGIISSSKYQTQGFWIYSMCSSWIKDLSRFVIIELDPKYRSGVNY